MFVLQEEITMKKQIAIAAAITASLALWAAVSPQTAGVKENTRTEPNAHRSGPTNAAYGVERTGGIPDNRTGAS